MLQGWEPLTCREEAKAMYSHSFEKVDSERNENIGWRTDDWRLRLGGRKIRGVHNVLHAKGVSGVRSSAVLRSKVYPRESVPQNDLSGSDFLHLFFPEA